MSHASTIHDAAQTFPPTSDVPVCEPTPLAELVVPHPCAPFGGMDNVPEALMPLGQQVADELDYGGLEQELPGEDGARACRTGAAAPTK